MKKTAFILLLLVFFAIGCDFILKEDDKVIGNSSNALLSELSLSTGTLNPEFNSETYTYSLNVKNESITITPTAAHYKSKITINGSEATSAEAFQVNLNLGENTITISVTAEDETSSQVYTLAITRDVDMAGQWEITSEIGTSMTTNLTLILTHDSEVALKFRTSADIIDVTGSTSGAEVTLKFTSKMNGIEVINDYTGTISDDLTTMQTSSTMDINGTTVQVISTFERKSTSTAIPEFSIPKAAITIDGYNSDWRDVTMLVDDDDNDRATGAPTSAEIDYTKLAINSAGDTLYFLIKLVDGATADTTVRYNVHFRNYNADTGNLSDWIELNTSFQSGDWYYDTAIGGSLAAPYAIDMYTYIEGSVPINQLAVSSDTSQLLASPFVLADIYTDDVSENNYDKVEFFGLLKFAE